MPTLIYATDHGRLRQAQRNLSMQDLQFVFEHGRRFRRSGALHIFLAARDVPSERSLALRFSHLEGTTLILDDSNGDAILITAYRNRRGLAPIRKKTKYRRSLRTAA